jgi:hypothetical protein
MALRARDFLESNSFFLLPLLATTCPRTFLAHESLHVQAAFMAGLKRKPDRNLIRAAASLSILVNTHLRPLTNAQRVAAGQTPLPAAVELNRRDLYGYLKSWGWSKKVPIRIHIHKFRPDNIVRYINYATAVTWIPPERLKFLDESTFASRSTLPLLPPPLALFLVICLFCRFLIPL